MDINEPCKLGAISKLYALDQVRGNAPGGRLLPATKSNLCRQVLSQQ
jgi:hypothetical protein